MMNQPHYFFREKNQQFTGRYGIIGFNLIETKNVRKKGSNTLVHLKWSGPCKRTAVAPRLSSLGACIMTPDATFTDSVLSENKIMKALWVLCPSGLLRLCRNYATWCSTRWSLLLRWTSSPLPSTKFPIISLVHQKHTRYKYKVKSAQNWKRRHRKLI